MSGSSEKVTTKRWSEQKPADFAQRKLERLGRLASVAALNAWPRTPCERYTTHCHSGRGHDRDRARSMNALLLLGEKAGMRAVRKSPWRQVSQARPWPDRRRWNRAAAETPAAPQL